MLLLLIGSLLLAGEGPVAIRTPSPSAPLATAGTGLLPEVTARLSIDERGRVTEVRVLGVTPSSEHDGAFRSAAERTLLEWRYAPVIVEGTPAPTTLEVAVRFAPVARSVVTRAVHRELLRMGREQRAKYLESEGARAREHLVEERTRKFSTARFVVYTDATSPEVARNLAERCEAVATALDRLLARQVPPEPEPYKLLVLAYSGLGAYEKASGPHQEHAHGLYYPAGLIATHLERPAIEDVTWMLTHLATHAYLERYVARPGILLPAWLVEGFADYVANSEIREGRLLPGPPRSSGGEAAGLTELRQALARGDALPIPLERLLSGAAEDFTAAQRPLYHTVSWALVHFMQHGDERWAHERFPRLLLFLAEGYPPLETFREMYGEPREVEATFRSHVGRP